MSRLRFLKDTLDFLLDSRETIRQETQKPHGYRVDAGLRNGAYAAAGTLGAGIATYMVTRYMLGWDNQSSSAAALQVGMISAAFGFMTGYRQYAGDQESMRSLRTIARPANSYFSRLKEYLFA